MCLLASGLKVGIRSALDPEPADLKDLRNLDQEKAALREEILKVRQGLAELTVLDKSRRIAKNLFALKEFKASKNLLVFLSLSGEVQTNPIIEEAFQAGKQVYVPVVDKANRVMKIAGLPSMDIEFVKGPFGIREPAPDFIKFVSPAKLDFVLVPGLAFDLKGGRVGFGGGYFDRLFQSCDAVRVAVAFDFQIRESVPRSLTDAAVQKIITESRTIVC